MKKVIASSLSAAFFLILLALIKTDSPTLLSPNHVGKACNHTDPANTNFEYYTEYPNNDLLTPDLIVGSVRFKSRSFTRQTESVSLLKDRHLLMENFRG